MSQMRRYTKLTYQSAPLRPNVLLYKDNFRLPERQDEQMANFNNFNQNNAKKSVCIIEIGAGVSMKGLRKIGDSYLADDSHKATLIRINPKYESIALHDLLQRVRKDELTKEDASNFDFVGGVGERSLFENSEDFNMEEVIPRLKPEKLKEMIKEEEDFYKNMKNEMIDLRMTGLQGINVLYDELEKITGLTLEKRSPIQQNDSKTQY